MSAIMTALGTMVAIAVIGWLFARLRILGPGADAVLARVVFTVAGPSLLFVTISHADLHLLLTRSAATTALSTGAIAVAAALVYRLVRRRSAGEATMGALASSYVNAGNLGLPLAVYLLGDAVAVVPALLFQLLILAPVAFTILDARRPGAAPSSRPYLRALKNPIIIGTLLGIAGALLPWDLPEAVFAPFQLIGAAAAPLALLTLGMGFARGREAGAGAGAAGDGNSAAEVPSAAIAKGPVFDVAFAVAMRAVAHPLVTYGVGMALGLEGKQLFAVVIMAALPTAQNVLVYAVEYGQGQALARGALTASTLLALPVMIGITALLMA